MTLQSCISALIWHKKAPFILVAKWNITRIPVKKVVEILDFVGIVGRSLHIFHIKLEILSYLRTQPCQGKSCGNRGNCTKSSIVPTSSTLWCTRQPTSWWDDRPQRMGRAGCAHNYNKIATFLNVNLQSPIFGASCTV